MLSLFLTFRYILLYDIGIYKCINLFHTLKYTQNYNVDHQHASKIYGPSILDVILILIYGPSILDVILILIYGPSILDVILILIYGPSILDVILILIYGPSICVLDVILILIYGPSILDVILPLAQRISRYGKLFWKWRMYNTAA